MNRAAAVSALLLAMAGAAAAAPAQAVRLRCEYLQDPVGIDAAQPRLGWQIASDRRDERQAAWHVLVASTPERLAADQGDLWDSGRVASDQSHLVRYAGKPLASRQRCHWKVRAWTGDDAPTA